MELALARGSSERENGNFPPLALVNMLAEPSMSDPEGVSLLSRPPMVEFASIGAGPINGTYQRPGLFGGDLFTVSGNTLYRSGIAIGAINGSGPVSWASSRTELVLTRGQSAWSFNGTNLAAVVFPDGANVRAVGFVAGLFLYARSGSDRWYWSALNDGRTIDGLDFATAESEPDELYDLKIIGDNLYLLGANSGEVWVLTGNTNLPFSRVIQRNLGRGVQGPGCAEVMDNTLIFIGSDAIVWRMEEVARRISDHALEEKIRTSSAGQCFHWLFEGHLVFTVRLDQGTWGFDISAGRWVELRTFSRENWAAICSTQVGSEPLFGDSETGTVWQFGELDGTNEDAGEVAFERMFTAGAPLKSQPQPIANVLVDGNEGATQAESGQGSDPSLEMRYSRNGGRSWSGWRSSRFGAKGEFRRLARYVQCGFFDPPGALLQFRMTDPAPLRVSSVRINESLAGRGR
jgi:hypothetical protein